MITWEAFALDKKQTLAAAVGKAKARYLAKNAEKPNAILLHPQKAEHRASVLGLRVVPGDGAPGTLILQPDQFALGNVNGGFRTTVLDPRDYFDAAPGKAAVRRWRTILKTALLLGRMSVRQQQKCYCGAAFAEAGCHLHEGIVYKGQVAGAHWAWMIFSSVNCVLLCAKCNTSHQNVPSRREVYDRKCEELGKETVDEWIKSLPSKTNLASF